MTDCFVFSIRNCGHWVIFIGCEETRPRKHVPQIPRAPSCGRNRREKWLRRVISAAESGRHLSRALNSINKRPSELTSGWKYRMTKKRRASSLETPGAKRIRLPFWRNKQKVKEEALSLALATPYFLVYHLFSSCWK